MRLLYFFISFFLSGALLSQVITQAANEPVVGDNDRIIRLDTSAFKTGMPISVTGSNVVWDFSALSGTFPIVIDSFITPSAAPGYSAFTSATYAQHRQDLYTFYRSTPQKTELLGGYSPSLTITFTDMAVAANYPVSYGYYLNDPVSGFAKTGSNNGACNGSITVSADGTGTVLLPYGISVANVLRLKTVETLTISSGVIPVASFNQVIYNYYMLGKKFPILNMTYSRYESIIGTPTITATMYGTDDYIVIAGAREYVNSSAQLYPNPFVAVLSTDGETVSDVAFYNAMGERVLHVQKGDDPEIAALPPGVYLVSYSAGERRRSQKMVKL
jgi:hypothetical protein